MLPKRIMIGERQSVNFKINSSVSKFISGRTVANAIKHMPKSNIGASKPDLIVLDRLSFSLI